MFKMFALVMLLSTPALADDGDMSIVITPDDTLVCIIVTDGVVSCN